MDSAELPRLIYLVLLGAAVVGWFIAENRGNLGQTARMAMAWGMIFVGIVTSLVTGLVANGGVFLGSLSWVAMGVAVVATVAAVVGYYYFATREA